MAEPQYNLTDFLRSVLTDYNATARIGDNWIYPDQPLVRKLSLNSFPRVSVETISETGELAGADSQDFIQRVVLRITVYDKFRRSPLDHPALPSKRANIHLVRTIVRDIVTAIRTNWNSDTILQNYYDYNIRNIRQLPYDDELDLWRMEIELELKGINVG